MIRSYAFFTLIPSKIFISGYKKCDKCKRINEKLELEDREWRCPECGTLLERDHNASVNIEEEGLKILKAKGIKIINDNHNHYAVGLTVKAFGENMRQTFGL